MRSRQFRRYWRNWRWGGVVIIDAMGCQHKIAEQIVGQQADYQFSLKGNSDCQSAEVCMRT